MYISESYLKNHKNYIFVFGDNTFRKGRGGAAKLRDLKNTYGFITKRAPRSDDDSFYLPWEYKAIYEIEITKLKKAIEANPDKTYLISKLGSNLANRFKIFERVIRPNIKKDLAEYKNIKFLW